MTPNDWNRLLAPAVPWQEAYAVVAREARAYLIALKPAGVETMSTMDLAAGLYPPQDMRGEVGVAARKRIFKALAALAKHELDDCVVKGEPRAAKIGGKTVTARPWRWRAPQPPAAPQPELAGIKEMLERFIDCGRCVIDNWVSGDLAGAVNALEEACNDAAQLLSLPGKDQSKPDEPGAQ